MNEIRKRVLDLVRNGAYAFAVRTAFEAARRQPTPEWFELLAYAEAAAGYTKAAIKTLSQAIALAPGHAAYLFQRGQLCMAARLLSAAIEDMGRVIEIEQASGVDEFSPRAETLREEALAMLNEETQKRTPLRVRSCTPSQGARGRPGQ